MIESIEATEVRGTGRAAAAMLVRTRLPVIAAGAIAVAVLGTLPPPNDQARWRVSSRELVNLFARWDTFWYNSIATRGYHWNPSVFQHQNVVFFPLYPLLMRLVGTTFGGHPIAAGVVISLAAFTGAVAILYRLAALDLGEERAWAAVLLLSTFPFALFYSVAYTESLFLFLSAAAFYTMRRERYVWAGLAGVCAGLSRPNGLWLVVPLALLALSARRGNLPPAPRRRTAALLAALTPALGTMIYCAYLFWRFGDPIAWIHGQAAWGLPLAGHASAVEPGDVYSNLPSVVDVITWVGNIAAFALAIRAVAPVWRRFGPAYAVMIPLTVVPPVVTHLFMSGGRFAAPLFPIFFWLATVLKGDRLRRVVSVFMLVQLVLAVLFFLWRPVV
jgi:hypothetical protein